MRKRYYKSLLGAALAFILGFSCCWLSSLLTFIGGASLLTYASTFSNNFQLFFLLIATLLLVIGLNGFIGHKTRKNNRSLLLAISLFITIGNFAQSDPLIGDFISGKWQTHDKRAIVEIVEGEKGHYGRIIGFNEPANAGHVDVSEELHNTYPLGLKVMESLISLNGKHYQGKIFDPESTNTYDCKVWLSTPNTLKVRDYCGSFHKTFEWTRIE